MNFKQRMARNAKIEHVDGRSWGGYLTATEIVSLIDEDGFTPSSALDVERARQDVKSGRANPRWFYFEVPKGTAFGT